MRSVKKEIQQSSLIYPCLKQVPQACVVCRGNHEVEACMLQTIFPCKKWVPANNRAMLSIAFRVDAHIQYSLIYRKNNKTKLSIDAADTCRILDHHSAQFVNIVPGRK